MASAPNREKALRAIYTDKNWRGSVGAIYAPACRTCGRRSWAAQNNLRGPGFRRGGFYCSLCDADGLMVLAAPDLVPQIEDALISQMTH
jgi:hypothetical protein